jgi:acyl-CoA reductase-like NAD-dependent aldehyde dehydrogenase
MAQMTATPVRMRGFYLQGKWTEEGTLVDIYAPYDGAPIAQVFQATREHAEKAIQGAVQAFGTTRKLPAFERQRVLRSIAQHMTSRKEEFARTLALEAGKPIKAARAEVERSIFTFIVAAEETTRIPGEYLSLDWQQHAAGRCRTLGNRAPISAGTNRRNHSV